jgi:UDP:flavonoid glycosyltransferase YjiC (YdhE family)
MRNPRAFGKGSTLRRETTLWRSDSAKASPEFAALVAAEQAGIPHACVAVHSRPFEAWASRHVIESLDALRRATGLDPDGGSALRAERVFTAFPASLDADTAEPGTQTPIRVAGSRGTAGSVTEAPSWAAPDGVPFPYVTLGTVSGRSERVRAAYREILSAIGTLPVRALLTTGPVMTVQALGTVPDNVTVREFVPQAEVFTHATAVVCHGGSGTLLGGLAAGLPMVVVPLFADQPYNARAVDAAGAGIAVLSPEAAPLRAAVQRVLVDTSLREGALRIADEMLTMASLDDAAGALLALAHAGTS